MTSIKDKALIEQFIKLLENNMSFKGSPKGSGPASPYAEKNPRSIYGQSDYAIQADRLVDEEAELKELEEEEEPKVKIAKYFENSEEGAPYDETGDLNDEEWLC